MPDNRPLVLLVQLPIPPPGPQPIRGNVPLAAGYLKLHARRSGLEDAYRIEILPAALANTLGDTALVAEICRQRPWMLGFTCYLWNIERSLAIAARVKQTLPEVLVLVGGPEITADNQWVLADPAVDFACMGEGEQTLADLLAALCQYGKGAGPCFRTTVSRKAGTGEPKNGPVPQVAGLWSRGNAMPPPRAAIADLASLSSPYLEGILDAFDERILLLETTRGCRFRCKFCYYPKSYDSIHFLPPEQIAAILAHARQCRVSEVFLLDPTLNQRPDFAGFLRLLAEGNREQQFTYSAELRAEGITPETARLLREANFQEVEVGLQSVDPEAQRLMGRRVQLASLERGARAMLDEGIRVRLDLILGLPGDTVDSVRRGIEYLQRTRIFSELQIFNLSVLPGTAFRAEAESLGLEFQPRPPYYVLKTPTLGTEQLYRLMEEAQDAFAIEFDPLGPPALPEIERRQAHAGTGEAAVSHAIIDLDAPAASDALPPPERWAQAFTIWLRAADFRARRREAARLVERVLAANPFTTLQVVLEPTADLHRLASEVLETLLTVCYRTPTYLDWYYSLHPAQLLGAKRLVVLAPWSARVEAGHAWIDAVGQCATILWQGGPADEETLEEWEYAADESR